MQVTVTICFFLISVLRSVDESNICESVETDLPHLEATLTKQNSKSDEDTLSLDALLKDRNLRPSDSDVTEVDADVSSEQFDWSALVIALLAAGVVLLLLLALAAVVIIVLFARRRSKRKRRERKQKATPASTSHALPVASDSLLQEKNLRNNIYSPNVNKELMKKSVEV